MPKKLWKLRPLTLEEKENIKTSIFDVLIKTKILDARHSLDLARDLANKMESEINFKIMVKENFKKKK